MESLSVYAHQFLGQADKPDVDSTDGLSPAISTGQEATDKSPRSIVGTVTKINDYLYLLLAHVEHPIYPSDYIEVTSQSVNRTAGQVTALFERTKIQVVAPIMVEKKGQHKEVSERIQKEGYIHVRADGEIYDLGKIPEPKKDKKYDIVVVINRIIVKGGVRSRLFGSLETALRLAGGYVLVDVIGEGEMLFGEHYVCPYYKLTADELKPRLFSFNASFRAYPDRDGLDVKLEVSQDLVIPDKTETLSQGAIIS